VRKRATTIDETQDASFWSRLAIITYWLAIVLAIGWIVVTQNPDASLAAFLIAVGVLAAALPMERHAAAIRLREFVWRANNDPLTGLHNRSYFMTQLSRQMRRRRTKQSSLAVMMLDLDRFKNINDTLGHASGDKLLQEVAAQLRKVAPVGSTIARLGGDEFGVSLEVSSEAELESLGAEMVKGLSFRTTLNSQPVWINVSIGGAIATIPRPTLVELLSMADIALYQAKNGGRNRMVVFEPHRPMPTVGQLSMEYELRLALERNQMLLYYQPIVDLDTQRVTGFEALVRWNHPNFGFVTPNSFIPIAEENGWIQDLGSWVLAEACRQMSEWHRVFGDHLGISINLSALQFARSDITQEVRQVVASSGIRPQSVRLEITETALAQDEEFIMRNIADLKQIGASLVLDDFGVGYSSLDYLRKFPSDYLKIDKSFIDEIEEERSFAIIKAAIQVGHVLGMQIVAEGVETSIQLDRLRKADCDFAQGFLFHKPLRSVEVANLLIDEMYRYGPPQAHYFRTAS
jgi:diguanylate cyclase (GGDEF)-like protein